MEIFKFTILGLMFGTLVGLVVLTKSIASDIETIKAFTDPETHCNGQILWNVEWDVFECKEIK